MPSVALDNDAKYQNLLDLCIEMSKEKNGENARSNFKIFGNILEALNWLTESKDATLTMQLDNDFSAYSMQQSHLETVLSGKNINESMNTSEKINVLITGSLYLVGLSLKVLNYKIY